MPPMLALFLTVAFIFFLFARDFRERPNVTAALWLPFLWIVVSPGSRFLSQWLTIFGLPVGGVTVEDGSPIDAAFFLAVIASGVLVLHQRRVTLAKFIGNNYCLTLFLAYCLLAILWSDFPYVSFKRWIKLLGDPAMALIVLTEPDVIEAVTRLMKRCAFVMFPVSILFIKYFPNLGRLYDVWEGHPMYTGIATNKNELGFDCWILGAVLFWHALQVLQWDAGRKKRDEILLCAGLLCMDLWLLKMAHSASSFVALMLASGVMLFLGLRWVQKRHVTGYLLGGIAICALAGLGLGFLGSFIHLLGRDETFTGRTDIWHILWNWKVNPIVGTGFESFWLGDRREAVQNLYPGLNQAHNGYLETYLNLGGIGVALTVGILLATYGKSRHELFRHFEFGRLRMAYLIAFIVYNWTEASFRQNAFPFFMFFLVAIDMPKSRKVVPELVKTPSYQGTHWIMAQAKGNNGFAR
ncbi:MAG TPA: O-antigen ligase family protein [Verrucomicrobiae bacterium]